jgi:hypothetical protein
LYHKNFKDISVSSGNKTRLKNNLSSDASTYFNFQVHPNVIDIVGITDDSTKYFIDNQAKTWVEASYLTKTNSIIKD